MDKTIANQYVPLHLHTDYSLLDGMGKAEDYVKRAKELGMPAIAITDHGTMAGLVTMYDACKAAGIKFIGGCEFYSAPWGRTRFDKNFKQGEKAYDHLIVLFKNETGYKNGCILMARSHTEGFYRKPRIDFDILKEHHEGLIVLSACVAGAVPQAIIHDDMDKAREIIRAYKDVFGDDYYLEVQNHGLLEERKVISGISLLAKELGVKIVATNDSHYVNLSDKEAHDWLLCMQTDKTISDPSRMRYEGNYHLASGEEMMELFPGLPEAVSNTKEVADKCSFEFMYGNYRMPKVHIPEEYGTDYFGYMEHLVWEGFEKRYPATYAKRDQAKKDVEYELGVIKQMGFAEYFLDTRKTVRTARSMDVLVGPGRGSGAGSRVCYCLGITDIDPIPYGLLFERFLNPERVSMPDIDVDYEYSRKDDVIRSEAESNGYDCFAKIRTFGTMLAKAVLKSCAKVSGIEDHVAVGNKLAKYIVDNQTLREAYDANAELRAYVQGTPLLQKIWDIALKLEGTKKSAGTHACGHIPTPIPCEQLFPCALDKETGYLVCEYDMTQAEHLGNLKKDLLMLRNLTIISATQKLIKKEKGIDIPLWTNEILNDRDALRMIAAGDTDGVFQLESEGMKKFMKELKPDRFEDIIAGVALYRPGPMDFIPAYIEGKRHPESVAYLTPELKPILENTYGQIVYQEQVMQIVQRLAGFSMGRADVVRKAMGKKKMDIMVAERQRFVFGDESLGIPGCIKNGIPQDIAEHIYDMMIDFAKYAFNKSHAAAYAAISMQTAYLKAHYPHEFTAGLLTSVMDNSDKLMKYVGSVRKAGTSVLPPDINKSASDFTIEDGAVRFGLLAIKAAGKDMIKFILDDRERNGKYQSFEDFLERTSGTIPAGAVKNLILSGAFDSFGYTRKAMAGSYQTVMKKIRKEQKTRDENQLSLFDLFPELGSDAPSAKSYGIVNTPEYPAMERARLEKEAAGLYISAHPMEHFRKWLTEMGAYTMSSFSEEESAFEAGDTAQAAGILVKIRYLTTRNGKQMRILTLEDETGTAEALSFPRDDTQPMLTEGNAYFVSGKISNNGSFIADRIRDITLFPPKRVWVATESSSLYSLRKKATEFVRGCQGAGDQIVICSKSSRAKEVLKRSIEADSDVCSRLKAEFGQSNIFVQTYKN